MESRVIMRVARAAANASVSNFHYGTMLRAARASGARGLASASSSGGASSRDEERCRLLVVGGGSGGCSLAAKFARTLSPGDVVVLEPADMHYYQPMFTLIGGGLKKLNASCKPMSKVLPKRARWIQDSAAAFLPEENLVETLGGRRLRYDFMVIAMGIELRYQDVPGLQEALDMPGSGVCSNYSPLYVERTWDYLQNLREGQALFTYPNTPVKCAGAPQKIMYLVDDYLRRMGRRGDVKIDYHTCLSNIFGIKYYADALWPIANARDLNINCRSLLVEVRPEKREAVFANQEEPHERTTVPYTFLHATPPQCAPAVVRECTALADSGRGCYLAVDMHTMQHDVFPNVFGVGDCTSLPTSKTAAAAAAQIAVVKHTLGAAMRGKPIPKSPEYNGYSSCPLVTGKGKCVMAEFDYDGTPLETFPLDQRKERWTMYHVKATFMPMLYWYLMLNGFWDGPSILRKALHLGFGR